MKKFVSWRRVSTKKQGKSGLGLSAQKTIIDYFVEAEGGELIADFAETYTGKDLSGCTELQKAIAFSKANNAILIIAKTDRFRNTAEALNIYDTMGDNNIYFCDLPHTDKFTVTIFFALAEREALQVSIRTKAALNEIKAKHERGETHLSKAGNICAQLGRPKGCKGSKAAGDAGGKAVHEAALSKPENVRFKKWLDHYESKNGRIRTAEDINQAVCELTALDYKTSRGLDFNAARVKAMIRNIRTLYSA